MQPVLGRYLEMSFVLKDLLPEMKEFPGDFCVFHLACCLPSRGALEHVV